MKQRQNSGSLCGVIFRQAIFQQEYLLNSVYVPPFKNILAKSLQTITYHTERASKTSKTR